MKKTASLFLALALTISTPVFADTEPAATPQICPFTINGTEFEIGMTYADCMAAVEASSIEIGTEFHIPALRIGVTPMRIDDLGPWIEATGCIYSKDIDDEVEFSFVVPMPEGFDTKDTDAAVALIEESGKLTSVAIRDLTRVAESMNITEVTIDGEDFTSARTGEALDELAERAELLSETSEANTVIGRYDEDLDLTEMVIYCYFTDETRSELESFDFEIEPEYFMGFYY